MTAPTLHHVEATTHGRLLVQPSPSSHPRAIVFGFHGYAETGDSQLERLAQLPDSREWTLASIEALNHFYRGRNRTTIAGWMTRRDREIAIADNVRYVERCTETALAAHTIAGGRATLVHAGFSQGVAMAFRAAVFGRRQSHGVCAVGADVPPELLENPDAAFPRVLLVRGARDEWYTSDTLAADTAALLARSVDVRAVTVDGGHEWNEAVSAEVGRFVSSVAARSDA